MAEKAVKFSEEEMKQINELQGTYLNLQNTLGQMSVQRMRLEQQVENLDVAEENVRTSFVDTQKKERDFVDQINKKYGDGNLDVNTGIFIPKPIEETPDKTI